MNEFLSGLSADIPLLWALFVLGVVAASSLTLSLVSGLLLRLGSALAAPFGRRKTPNGDTVRRDDVVS